MSENTTLVERHFRSVETNDWSAVSEVLSPDVVTEEPSAGTMRGIDAFVRYAQGFHQALPDGRLVADRVLEAGSTVVVEGRYQGTFTGPLPSPQGEVVPNGRSLDLPFCDVFDIEAGRIRRHRTYYDRVAFAVQLGLMPEPAS